MSHTEVWTLCPQNESQIKVDKVIDCSEIQTNTHALEKGIKCYDYIWIDHQLYRPDDKVCDICAASIRENIKEKWEYFYKTGDRLNFTKDPRYSKYYTRY